MDRGDTGIEPEQIEQLEQIESDGVVWRFDRAFLTSNWTCIWGNGCHGIGTVKDAALGQGCCSVGAEMDGIEEAMTVAASAAALTPELFEHHAEAAADGVFSDADKRNTRVVDGACIFLNRPDFEGGAGCALHLAAVEADESPIDWKPSVCWQLPVHVDWTVSADEHGVEDTNGIEIATVRGWNRGDWGHDGDEMAWCCTERIADGGTDEAYIGDRPVIDSLAEEIEAIVGTPVFVELRRRLTGR